MADITKTGLEEEYAPTTALSMKDWLASDEGKKTMGFGNSYTGDGFGEGQYYGGNVLEKLAGWLNGSRARAEDAYQTYLTNLANQNEYKATQSANLWSKYMADTEYQRSTQDLLKAGLNPWLAANSSISGASTSSTAKANYDGKKNSTDKTGNNGRNLALLLLAIAKIAAAA